MTSDVDVGGGKLYWARVGWEFCGPTSTDPRSKPSFTESSKGVALDVGGGKIYWGDYSDVWGNIKRANLDGSQGRNPSSQDWIVQVISP